MISVCVFLCIMASKTFSLLHKLKCFCVHTLANFRILKQINRLNEVRTEHNFGQNFLFFQCHSAITFKNSTSSSDQSIFHYRYYNSLFVSYHSEYPFHSTPSLTPNITRQQGCRHKSCPASVGCAFQCSFFSEKTVFQWFEIFEQKTFLGKIFLTPH